MTHKLGHHHLHKTGPLKAAPKAKTAPLPTPPAAAPAAAHVRSVGADHSQVSGSSAFQTALAVPEVEGAAPVADLQGQVQQILGPGVKFSQAGGSTWSVKDMQALLSTVQALPASAYPALANTTFSRVPTVGDGSDMGDTSFQSIDLGGKLTIAVADGASANGAVSEVLGHEIGHAALGGGRFDPDAVREFGKLSHWLKQDGSMVDGHDSSGLESDIDPGASPLNGGNFVSDPSGNGHFYGKSSASEDFAESFRAYVLHPDQLMAAAPDKFLYLNAQFGKYSAAQLQTVAANNGVDLPVVMAQLKASDLRPETLARIGQSQGLAAAGNPGSGAGDMIAAVMANADNPDFVKNFSSGNAAQALGPDVWNRLSKSEQALVSQPAYAQSLLNTAKANKAAPADAETDGDTLAFKNLMKLLEKSPSDGKKAQMALSSAQRVDYLESLIHDKSVWNNLDPAFKAIIDSPKGRDAIKQLVNNPKIVEMTGKLWGGVSVFGLFTIGPKKDPMVLANFDKNISRVGPSESETAKGLLSSDNGNDIKNLADALYNLSQGLDTTNFGGHQKI